MVSQTFGSIGTSITANETQIGGNHYKSCPIEPWDYISRNNIPYLEGNVIKYVTRWREKGGLADLEKAQHYLQKVIELHKEGVEGYGIKPTDING